MLAGFLLAVRDAGISLCPNGFTHHRTHVFRAQQVAADSQLSWNCVEFHIQNSEANTFRNCPCLHAVRHLNLATTSRQAGCLNTARYFRMFFWDDAFRSVHTPYSITWAWGRLTRRKGRTPTRFISSSQQASFNDHAFISNNQYRSPSRIQIPCLSPSTAIGNVPAAVEVELDRANRSSVPRRQEGR